MVRRLVSPGQRSRVKRFWRDVTLHTPLVKMVALLIGCWVLFSIAIFSAEQGVQGSAIHSISDALYWGVAAFSTAGIADTPTSDLAKAIGGVWIVVGSTIFFGTIVATITMYFMRPLQRPLRRIVDTIEYNLEQLNELSVEELELLKHTTDTLIEHVEAHRKRHEASTD